MIILYSEVLLGFGCMQLGGDTLVNVHYWAFGRIDLFRFLCFRGFTKGDSFHGGNKFYRTRKGRFGRATDPAS
ncbi:MAG: hypothetical protein GF363_10900 [Chitinivibrionales bacterium]|nr:hypothetical protein [Chitinivibrionales bacterium]